MRSKYRMTIKTKAFMKTKAKIVAEIPFTPILIDKRFNSIQYWNKFSEKPQTKWR
jgi:hypothetical protein